MKQILKQQILGSAVLALFGASAAGGGAPDAREPGALEWHHTFTGELLDVQPTADETQSGIQRSFLASGVNGYLGDAAAIETGAQLYLEKCAICHGLEGRGRMAPSLADDVWVYDKNRTDKGMFETVWGGAAGVMTPFRGVLSQDEILRVIAYVRSLEQK